MLYIRRLELLLSRAEKLHSEVAKTSEAWPGSLYLQTMEENLAAAEELLFLACQAQGTEEGTKIALRYLNLISVPSPAPTTSSLVADPFSPASQKKE